MKKIVNGEIYRDIVVSGEEIRSYFYIPHLREEYVYNKGIVSIYRSQIRYMTWFKYQYLYYQLYSGRDIYFSIIVKENLIKLLTSNDDISRNMAVEIILNNYKEDKNDRKNKCGYN